jgi:hypothetical protein
MEINTEKVFERGKKAIKIVDFKALKREELPEEYTQSAPCVYEAGGYLMLFPEEIEDFVPHVTFIEMMALTLTYGLAIHKGQTISVGFWNAICKTVGKAGTKLKEINKGIDKQKEEWNGTKVYKW